MGCGCNKSKSSTKVNSTSNSVNNGVKKASQSLPLVTVKKPVNGNNLQQRKISKRQ